MNFVRTIPLNVFVATLLTLIIHVTGLVSVLSENPTDFLVFGDSHHYLELATNLEKGNGFVYEEDGVLYQELFRVPGLPFTLSLFLNDEGSVHAIYYFLLTILSALIIPISLFGFVNNLFKQQIASIVVWLYAIDPLTTIFTWHPQTEGLLMLFFIPGLFFFSHALLRKRILFAVISGLLLGISIYIRPVIYPLLLVGSLVLILYLLFKKNERWQYVVITSLVIFILLTPWMQHVDRESGKFAITASGWWNVYSDYVSSIRAVKNGTGMVFEKKKLENIAETELGIPSGSFQSPESSDILKDYALNEIRQNIPTVIKLQSLLTFNYFTNTSYQAYFGRLGIIERIPREVSPSHVLLSEGLSGMPKIYSEMKRVYFIPVIERIWGVGLLMLALLGLFIKRREPVIWLFVVVITLGLLTSSAIGLGVEARLRIPILPIYYVFVAVSLHSIYSHFSHRRRES